MGHEEEEEDKELMMIRMETLKTMIGKLKNKTGQKHTKEGSQSPVKDKVTPVNPARSSILNGQSSPITCEKHHILSKSNPVSPCNGSRKIGTVIPVPKDKPQRTSLYQLTSTSLSPIHVLRTSGTKSMPVFDPSANTFESNLNLSNSSTVYPRVEKNMSSQKILNSFHPSIKTSNSLYSAKSHSDSEISVRKKDKTVSSLIHTASTQIYETSKSTLRNKNDIVPKLIELQKNDSSIAREVVKPLYVKKTPSHTITRPVSMIKTSASTTSLNISSVQTSSNRSDSTEPGNKVLFERPGKVLFDRHSTPSGGKILSNNKSRPKSTPNFAQEFKIIRNKHALRNATNLPKTTRTKFYSSGYIPPETCEKARTILSKYKLVHNQGDTSVAGSTKKDINANYSPVLSNGGTPVVTQSSGKILYERKKSNQENIYSSSKAYLRRGKPYNHVGKSHVNAYQDFVSRRIKYIRSVHPSLFTTKPFSSIEPIKKPTKKEIILSRHGTNYKVAGNLKSLRRLSSNQGQQPKHGSISKPAVHLGKFHLQRSNSKLTSKNGSAKQYVASQVLKKNLLNARKKLNKENYCLFYNRFGKCKRGEKCHYIHDPDKIAICKRFLRGTCKDERCLFSHKLDPDKMPVCSYFLRGECGRDNCPYRHVNVGESASVCEEFLKGYCAKGKECVKKHILDCEEFAKTGSCSNGKSCLLAHRLDMPRKRKYSGSRPPKGFLQKQKKNATVDEPNIDKNASDLEGKKHMLPKFVSDQIKLLRENAAEKPTSFSGIKKFYESKKINKEKSEDKSGDLWGSDFIPLTSYSDESEDESSEYIKRMFSFKK